MIDYIEVSYIQLLLASIFIIIAAVLSVIYKLQLEKSLIIGALRTIIQLILLGYILEILFGLQNAILIFLVYIFMTFFAARIITSHTSQAKFNLFFPVFFSTFISYGLISFIVVAFIIDADPWWKPQYFLPIVGMIIGNSMTALSIALDRYLSDFKNKKYQIEMMLCLGAQDAEALHTLFVDALKAGMVPSINSLMAAGIVFIPGMMTGQILAGISPMEAVKYQIIVMLMIVASTAISSFLTLKWVERKMLVM